MDPCLEQVNLEIQPLDYLFIGLKPLTQKNTMPCVGPELLSIFMRVQSTADYPSAGGVQEHLGAVDAGTDRYIGSMNIVYIGTLHQCVLLRVDRPAALEINPWF